ncbi:uncharacterized protein KY384_005150 [Bacidia gigantensis]|uniref:uncharacterized protein n=1 Tax=Bacidia gigantensis TaxID=2732470 RepID=UPI001D04B770|nr:uncharacterized protein KY384_005150 [Bacidia gigantensis]KAG8529669.1 hypothetical protein KY384_005150 [Bacidia gigantensis]
MANEEVYQYTPINAETIRLFTIVTTATSISCQVHHHAVNDVPSYCALSYVWGDEEASECVKCDGRTIRISQNLCLGLQMLHKQVGSQLLWVDAICINQSNDQEKAAQVPLMSQIYALAQKVYIWLGPVSDNSDLAMSCLASLNETFSVVDNLEAVDRSSLASYDLPTFDDPIWPAITRLYFRKWFTRLWVMQEVLLAKDIYVLCGEQAVTWQQMVKFANNYRITRMVDDVLQHHKIPYNNPELPDHGFSAVPILDILRDMIEDGRIINCMSLLEMARRKLSKEPVDRVYGVLAILPSEMRNKIRVDYSPTNREQYWHTFIQLFTALIESEGPRALSMVPSRGRCLELPSWCPDFQFENSMNSLGKHYAAGVMPSHSDKAGPSSIKIGPGPGSLQMRGVLMDGVKSTFPLAWKYIDAAQYDPRSAAKVVECEEACLRLSRQIYGAQEEVPVQHVTTLVAGMTVTRSHYSMDQIRADYKLATQRFRDFCKQPSDQQGTQSNANQIAFDRYKSAMKITWRHTNFFTTTNGTIGVGLETIEPGDDICIVSAAHTPFIFRKNVGCETYAFHGEAYVHGLMDGQAFAAKDPVSNVQDFIVQ